MRLLYPLLSTKFQFHKGTIKTRTGKQAQQTTGKISIP